MSRVSGGGWIRREQYSRTTVYIYLAYIHPTRTRIYIYVYKFASRIGNSRNKEKGERYVYTETEVRGGGYRSLGVCGRLTRVMADERESPSSLFEPPHTPCCICCAVFSRKKSPERQSTYTTRAPSPLPPFFQYVEYKKKKKKRGERYNSVAFSLKLD